MLLEAWRDFEREDGDEKSQAEVQLLKLLVFSSLYFSQTEIHQFDGGVTSISLSSQVHQLLPRRVKKRRKVQGEDGSDQGWEEYFDYIFPEDEAAKPNLKLLAMTKMWKKNKDVSGVDAEEEEEEEEEQ